MRLLHAKTKKLCYFFADIPPYAILSHTWGSEEVTFQDIASCSWWKPSKKGYGKILKTCELALERGLEYAWVDTCCIDKSSSSELSEALNSMFQWYADSAVCFVFLEDLPHNDSPKEGIASCRWFSRGWTLQELIAPRDPELVLFYDAKWNLRGTKKDLAIIISFYTGISQDVLLGTVPVTDCSAAERMAWASSRKTTRIEDIAFCLLGIFNVNMALLYGEGTQAFRRLQETIVKNNNDLTISAWEDTVSDDNPSTRLFADSPGSFKNSSSIRAFSDDVVDFSVTNNGLYFRDSAPLEVVSTCQE